MTMILEISLLPSSGRIVKLTVLDELGEEGLVLEVGIVLLEVLLRGSRQLGLSREQQGN